jgi:hypothetical protein
LEDIATEWDKQFPNLSDDYERLIEKYHVNAYDYNKIKAAITQEYRSASSANRQLYSIMLGYAEEREKACETYYLNPEEIETEPQLLGWTKTLKTPE